MYFLYSAALTFLFILMLPVFLYQALRHGKYVGNFRERLGRLPEAVKGDGYRTVWVHAVSVGEFNAARPLLAKLKREMPGHRLLVSTTTMTGQRLARAAYPDKLDGVFYFPFDWRFVVRRALDHVRPSVVIILETELWANFLRECKERRIPVLVVNGRISPRSFSRYQRIRGFMSRALNDVSLLVMQSEGDADRARLLGAEVGRVRVCGNLKYDVTVRSQGSEVRSQKVNELFALASSRQLIVAGSTAPGEEAILLECLKEVRKRDGLEGARLLIAPRHSERFNEVAALISRSGFRFARRSEAGEGATESRAADVVLLDSIGELMAAYEFAAVVFVGGSLVPRGGHNVIEPALFAKPVIVGPYTENFRQIIADFTSADAIVQIGEGEADLSAAFAREVIRLLTDEDRARALGERAAGILTRNRGAVECVFAVIREVLDSHREGDD